MVAQETAKSFIDFCLSDENFAKSGHTGLTSHFEHNLGKFLYELAETEVTCMLGWPDQEQLSFTLFRQKVCEIISFCKESIR